MRPRGVLAAVREWTRRVWGAVSGRRSDNDLDRELAAHLDFAQDELRRQGHSPNEAARLARAAAGGRAQALEALRERRGLPWLSSSWLDAKLGLRLLVRNWGLTLVGGLAMSVAIGIAAVIFAAFDIIMLSPLPLDDGDRVVAIQVWDRKSSERRDASFQDVERWRTAMKSVEDVGAFQAIQRNVITADGSVELVSVAEISSSGFRVARVQPIMGRAIVDADLTLSAPPVVVIARDVWERRFASAQDVIGRELRLGQTIHTVVGVMPDDFRFPLNFHYWVPLKRTGDAMLRNAGPEGVVFGRLAPNATLARANAEASTLGLAPLVLRSAEREGGRPNPDATGARVVPYTFAFSGNVEPSELGLMRSLASLALVLLLLPPCANIAILNYARTVTRQQEFAARHALGGSRARIVWQLFIEALVLTSAAAGVALLIVRVVSVVVAARLQDIPGGPPFWLNLAVSYRTILFVFGLAVAGAAMCGLIPALQATGRLARLGSGALAGRTSLRLGHTWTALVIAQVAFSVAVLPIAAELAWGTLRSGAVGPGFAAEEFATARVSLEGGPGQAEIFATRQRELTQRLMAEASIAGVSTALAVPEEEPWVFVDIEGLDAPTERLNGKLPGFPARFNQVDASFFDVYQAPMLTGRGFADGDAVAGTDAAIINRNFAETIAPGGNALGRRFRYVRAMDGEWHYGPKADRWYQVVGVVANLPASTDARVAYHPAAPGQIYPANLQLRLRGVQAGVAERVRNVAATVDPSLHIEQVRTLEDIYRDHRFGDNLGAITIGAVTASVLLLSAAGLYALMAFTVAQRRREIGIRSALGAQPRELLAGVFKRAFIQIGAGAAVGLLAAFLIGRYVPIEQVGGLPIPGVLPGAAAFMLIVGVLAALGPARRGLRIHPTEALRND